MDDQPEHPDTMPGKVRSVREEMEGDRDGARQPDYHQGRETGVRLLFLH